MYCVPSMSYVTDPAEILTPASPVHSLSPVSARKALRLRGVVPWNTRLPAVVIVPEPACPLPGPVERQTSFCFTGSQATSHAPVSTFGAAASGRLATLIDNSWLPIFAPASDTMP